MNKHLKSGFYILCCLFLSSFFTSCLSGDDVIYVISDDAEILSFSMSSDSVSALSTVKFTIDQPNGLIYNHDSMAYQTRIGWKVIVNFTTASGINSILNVTDGDSIWITSGDSVDISKPLLLRSYAQNSRAKIYQFKLNIHQVDPDSLQYKQWAENAPFLNGADFKTVRFNDRYYAFVNVPLPPTSGYHLVTGYQSSDLKNWQKVNDFLYEFDVKGIQTSENGIYAYTYSSGELYRSNDVSTIDWQPIATEYPVKSILGFFNENEKNHQKSGLAVVVEKEGKKVYALLTDLTQWEYGTTIDEGFPLSDFSVINNSFQGAQRITIVSENTVWATENGLYWAKISQGKFPLLKGANAFLYNNELYLMNGELIEGYNQNIYYSIDGGLTWKTKEAKQLPPEDYSPRSNASLVLDKDEINFYIIGGKNQETLTDIWQGALNKKRFDY